mmetsp:Transcript_21936/g.33338  ORF Transcript_21936/g.33338 Transcript_21936/m.33338 type:complete len:104 (+) Transcript_21936:55-366(+)
MVILPFRTLHSISQPASRRHFLNMVGWHQTQSMAARTTGKRKNANSAVTCTADGDNSPWWEVDLEGLHDICKINIFNRDSLHYTTVASCSWDNGKCSETFQDY